MELTNEFRVDRPVFGRYEHPARLASPGRRGDRSSEFGGSDQHLGTSLEGGLFKRHVGSKVFVELRRI